MATAKLFFVGSTLLSVLALSVALTGLVLLTRAHTQRERNRAFTLAALAPVMHLSTSLPAAYGMLILFPTPGRTLLSEVTALLSDEHFMAVSSVSFLVLAGALVLAYSRSKGRGSVLPPASAAD